MDAINNEDPGTCPHCAKTGIFIHQGFDTGDLVFCHRCFKPSMLTVVQVGKVPCSDCAAGFHAAAEIRIDKIPEALLKTFPPRIVAEIAQIQRDMATHIN